MDFIESNFYDGSPSTDDFYHSREKWLFTSSEDAFVDLFAPSLTARDFHDGVIQQSTSVPWRIPSGKTLNLCPRIHEASLKAFFIRQKNSFSRLSVSQSLFESLIAHFSIFPPIKSFVAGFGTKSEENDIGPPQLRFKVDRSDLSVSSDFPSFECMYGIRFVELNHRAGSEPWSVRQSAIYHKYRRGGADSTWVFVAGSKTAEERFTKYANACPNISSANPFELHLIILDTALLNWRRYIADLTRRVQKQSTRVALAPAGPGKLTSLIDFNINFSDRQTLKRMEDQVLDILIMLDAANDTVSSLLEKYRLCSPQHSTESHCNPVWDPVEIGLREKLQEISLTKTKTDSLLKRIQGATSLLSSLLDYENAQTATANGVSLERLAQEARTENITMRVLTEKSTRDAASVKALTFITLVYLPATVVANFFSTGFVVHDEQGNLGITRNAWIYAASAVPLTVCTLLVWWAWTTWRTRRIASETSHATRKSEPDISTGNASIASSKWRPTQLLPRKIETSMRMYP